MKKLPVLLLQESLKREGNDNVLKYGCDPRFTILFSFYEPKGNVRHMLSPEKKMKTGLSVQKRVTKPIDVVTKKTVLLCQDTHPNWNPISISSYFIFFSFCTLFCT